jgi:hypothetical protein
VLHGKTQVIFRIVVGLMFIGIGVTNCIRGDYVFGGISLLAGAAFIGSLFAKKGGGQK